LLITMAAAAFYLGLYEIQVIMTNAEYEEFMLHVVNDKPTIVEIKAWLEQHTDT
jgi:hypothetical protein